MVRQRIVLAVLVLSLVRSFAAAAQEHWVSTGPFLPGGGILALAVDPSSADVIYASSESGVFKTFDGGGAWNQANSGLGLSAVQSIVVDPTLASSLYALSFVTGLYRSSDGGQSWQRVGEGVVPDHTSGTLVADPTGTLYVTSFGNGLFRTRDHGQTFTQRNAGLDSLYIASFAFAPSSPSTLYAATDTGVFRSIADGAWVKKSSLQMRALTVDPVAPNVVYGISSDGVFRSADGGATWTPRNFGLPAGVFGVSLVIDLESRTTLYLLTGSSLFKSADGGDLWVESIAGIQTTDLCPAEMAMSAIASRTLFLGNQCAGGVFKSVDAAASWSRIGDRFATPSVRRLLPDGKTTGIFAATSQGVFRASDRGASWTALNEGLDDFDLFSLAQAPADPSTLYAGATSGKVYRTPDGGGSWTETADLSPGNLTLIAVDPVSSQTVYGASYADFVRSKDGGTTWTKLRSFYNFISALTFNGNTLYVGTSQGEIWTTLDGGETWGLVTAFESYQEVSAIRVDPSSPSTLYAGWIFSGAGIPEFTPNGGVFKSIDGGATWQSIEEGLGVTDLLLQPGKPGVLYAAELRGGVLRSADAGSTWQRLENLGDGWISGFAIDLHDPSVLFAAMGNSLTSGVFTLRVDNRSALVVPKPDRPTRVVTRPD